MAQIEIHLHDAKTEEKLQEKKYDLMLDVDRVRQVWNQPLRQDQPLDEVLIEQTAGVAVEENKENEMFEEETKVDEGQVKEAYINFLKGRDVIKTEHFQIQEEDHADDGGSQ